MPAESSELCIRVRHHGSRTSIAVEGELDLSNKSVLRSHLDYVIADAPGDIELDLDDVSYLDSSSLAEILDAHSRLLDLGRHLRITKASRQVERLFQICGITHVLADWKTRPSRSLTVASASPPSGAGRTRNLPRESRSTSEVAPDVTAPGLSAHCRSGQVDLDGVDIGSRPKLVGRSTSD
jgi:anti-anti-sigma factor